MSKITVKAAAGVTVPREDNPRRYIDSDNGVTVERSAYYLRRIADGDLIDVTAKPAAAAKSETNEGVTSGKS
ncbi:DUF2635 domain-containing protein [Brenneria populi subsp. brevivirga]|uniref:DUF2635 domain-containing protein n=1 Tax=Brenneria populi TaxID=1505588 RepID=UPI002E1835F7|nr:DUF2635 domain-containing protein [Brenneria populi subsp. brevivirga]